MIMKKDKSAEIKPNKKINKVFSKTLMPKKANHFDLNEAINHAKFMSLIQKSLVRSFITKITSCYISKNEKDK
jgi:hypothetical protein